MFSLSHPPTLLYTFPSQGSFLIWWPLKCQGCHVNYILFFWFFYCFCCFFTFFFVCYLTLYQFCLFSLNKQKIFNVVPKNLKVIGKLFANYLASFKKSLVYISFSSEIVSKCLYFILNRKKYMLMKSVEKREIACGMNNIIIEDTTRKINSQVMAP